MASTGPMNGTAILLSIGATAVALAKGHTYKISAAEIDVSNKSSAGWKEILSGQRSGSIDVEAVFSENGTWGFDEAHAAVLARTLLTALVASTVSGDKSYSASCYITNLTKADQMESAAVWNATLVFTGPPTLGTVT